jgi:predicted nucleic acid-binding protein
LSAFAVIFDAENRMKLYLETTVPNFLFADDAPEKQEVTRQFFQWLKISPDELYISELVLAELGRAEAGLRSKLLEAVAQLRVEILPVSPEAEGLADRYMSDRVIPVRYRDDAIHVAIAVLNRLDVVVTWNMKHLANVRRIEGITRTNQAMSLPPIRIHTPEEVIDL